LQANGAACGTTEPQAIKYGQLSEPKNAVSTENKEDHVVKCMTCAPRKGGATSCVAVEGVRACVFNATHAATYRSRFCRSGSVACGGVR
jgi:hypothetical protein